MPPEWSKFTFPGTLGNNVSIINGRLEIGQIDTAGGIYRPIDTSGVTQIQVDYKANIPNTQFGAGISAILTTDISRYNFGSGYVQIGAGNNGTGSNVYAAVNYVPEANPISVAYKSILSNQSGFSEFLFSDIYRDGSVSQTLTNTSTGQKFASGNIALDGFKLNSMTQLAIAGVTTTGEAGWIDNISITKTLTAPVCTPPQVLRGDACVTPAPSPLTLAKLSEDVYNRGNKGYVGALGYSPSASQLFFQSVKLTADAPFAIQNAGSTPLTAPAVEDVFTLNVYRNDSDSHQYVIAIRGTDNIYNLVADGSFITGGKANNELIKYADILARKVAEIIRNDSAADITLTGHSMGGALAQVVGSIANIPVTSFDAPGVGEVIGSMKQDIATTLGDTVKIGAVAPVTNYRLYGDQVSFAGRPLLESTTYTVDNVSAAADIEAQLLPMGWLEYHSMTTLFYQLNKALGDCTEPQLCPKISLGIAKEKNITQDVIIRAVRLAPVKCLLAKVSSGIAANYGYCALELLSEKYFQNVLAGAVNLVDPGPGWAYSLEMDSGSAPLRSISLPIFGDVFGWALQYQDESGWSGDRILWSDSPFEFQTLINALSFIPLDKLGNPIYNPHSFIYDLQFDKTGEFSAIQATYGVLHIDSTIPEPSTLLLLIVSGLAYFVVMRRKAFEKRKSSCSLND